MNKKELYELIQSEIKEALIGKAKSANEPQKIMPDSIMKSEEITEEDFDRVLFFGGSKDSKEEKDSKTFTIRESNDIDIKMKTSEIKSFEDSFKTFLEKVPNATIKFDEQKNGYSLIAYKKPNGIEAIASGIINIGSDGQISWSYSIMNGLVLNAQNLKIDNENKNISEYIYDHFLTWQKTWRNSLNFPMS